MKKKEQIAYFEQQWKEMKDCLCAFILEGKQDDLHSFRVQIKRLRAYFILFEAADDKNRVLEFFKPVRKIFKHAGEIRNAHVNLLLGQKYKIQHEQFEITQRQIIENGLNDFKLQGIRYLKKIDRSHKSVINHLGPINKKQIKKFYARQLDQIASELARNEFNDELHASRSKIKILVYNHKLIGENPEQALQFNIDYLDDLQGNIGDWHDNILAIELFSSDEVNDRPVAARITKKNAKLQNHITALADDFLQKATNGKPAKEKPIEAEVS